jgi:hypothetical protein
MRRQLTEAELKLKTPKERYDAALAENRPLSAEHRTPLAPKDRNPNGSQGQNQNQRRGVSPAGSAARRTPSSSASKPSKARLSSAERWPSLTQVSPQTSALEMLRVKQEEGRQGTAAGGSGLTSPPEQPRSSQPEPTPGASLQDHGGADADSPSQAFSPVSAAALERHRRAVEAFREGTFDAVRPVGAHYCTAPHRTRHSSPRVAIAYIHFRAQQHRKLHQLVLWASHRAFLFRIVQRMEWKVRKRHFLSTFYIKMMILPRQARDKHRENSKKEAVLSQVATCSLTILALRTDATRHAICCDALRLVCCDLMRWLRWRWRTDGRQAHVTQLTRRVRVATLSAVRFIVANSLT